MMLSNKGFAIVEPAIVLAIIAIVVAVAIHHGCGWGNGNGKQDGKGVATEAPSEESSLTDSNFVILIDGENYFINGMKSDFTRDVLPALENLKKSDSGKNLTIRKKTARKKQYDDLIKACTEKGIAYNEKVN